MISIVNEENYYLYCYLVSGRLCLGTSGETIKDIMRYSKIDNVLEAMKKTLQWRHIAPTCPDTVPCTPCVDTDPFIMYNCPAIYFTGNADEFATEIFKGEFSCNYLL